MQFVLRCKIWVQNCGNSKLLDKPSSNLHRQNWLSSLHFDVGQFTSKMKIKLKPGAVPTIFEGSPLPKECMTSYPVCGRHNVGIGMKQFFFLWISVFVSVMHKNNVYRIGGFKISNCCRNV